MENTCLIVFNHNYCEYLKANKSELKIKVLLVFQMHP